MAPLIELTEEPSCPSSSLSQWLAASLVVAGILSILVWTTISMCACCAAKRRKTRLEEEQLEADAVIPPPPEPADFSTVMEMEPTGQTTKWKKPEEKPKKSEKEKVKKPEKESSPKKSSTRDNIGKTVMPKRATKEQDMTFVASQNVKAYRTLNLAQSEVFDKPGGAKAAKYVAPESLRHYITLAVADSNVFDKDDKTTPRGRAKRSPRGVDKTMARDTLALADSRVFDKDQTPSHTVVWSGRH